MELFLAQREFMTTTVTVGICLCRNDFSVIASLPSSSTELNHVV